MQSDNPQLLVHAHLVEYWQLKAEQVKRIEFRDQLIHIHLALVGAAMGWAIAENEPTVFLLVPWVCVIIGWAYIVNDDRISALGKYFRTTLRSNLQRTLNTTDEPLIAWEHEHRTDPRREERKLIQFVIDIVTFVLSGFVSLGAFISRSSSEFTYTIILAAVEAIMLLFLTYVLYRYLDRDRT